MKKLKNTIILFKSGALLLVTLTGDRNQNGGVRRIHPNNHKKRKQTETENDQNKTKSQKSGAWIYG